MANKKIKGADIVFYFVIAYVLIAGFWWSYLLFIKNEDALHAKTMLIEQQMKYEGNFSTNAIAESVELTRLTEQYSRQKWMIIGESAVLLILTILGIWRIYKGRQKEIEVVRQQQNFLLSITHELKSPIAAIKLSLETISKRTLTQEQLNMILSNAISDTDRLNKLVEDLLLSARVDGGYTYTNDPVDLNEVILSLIEHESSKFKGEIKINSDKANIEILGDYIMLKSAILNLLDNAIKYAPESEFITITLKDHDNSVSIDIADQGSGISKSERSLIFNKFYRIGSEDTRKTKGTGLGLHLAKQIIQAHKGHLKYKDNIPKGSIFQILLPKQYLIQKSE